MLLLKRGLKAPRRAPKTSAGARRRGAECPKLLVYIYRGIYQSFKKNLLTDFLFSDKHLGKDNKICKLKISNNYTERSYQLFSLSSLIENI